PRVRTAMKPLRSQAFVYAFALGLALACRTTHAPPPRTEARAAAARAFTTAFQKPAVLVADEIQIEGPPDLGGHGALRQDPEITTYTTKTVPEGLRQELGALPDSHVEVHGQLDAWSLAAFRRIVVLQRPGDVPVSVTARGNAYWAEADGS